MGLPGIEPMSFCCSCLYITIQPSPIGSRPLLTCRLLLSRLPLPAAGAELLARDGVFQGPSLLAPVGGRLNSPTPLYPPPLDTLERSSGSGVVRKLLLLDPNVDDA